MPKREEKGRVGGVLKTKHTHSRTQTLARTGVCVNIFFFMPTWPHFIMAFWLVGQCHVTENSLLIGWQRVGKCEMEEKRPWCVCVSVREWEIAGVFSSNGSTIFVIAMEKEKKEETAFRGGWGLVHCAWGTSPSYGHFLLPALTHTRSLVRYIRPSINCICMGGVSYVCLCVCVCSTLGFLLCSYFFWMAFITNRMCECMCVCVYVCLCVHVCGTHIICKAFFYTASSLTRRRKRKGSFYILPSHPCPPHPSPPPVRSGYTWLTSEKALS